MGPPQPFWQVKTPDEARALREAWTAWLGSFRWDQFAAFTWKSTLAGPSALGTINRFIRTMEWAAEAARLERGGVGDRAPRVFAVLGVQHGPGSDGVHVHALIGGLGRSPLVGTRWAAEWAGRGDLYMEPYRPFAGGAAYLIGQAEEVGVVGELQEYQARVRGRRPRTYRGG